MKRAAIYSRVSTAQQSEQGTSLVTQRDACHAYALAHGYTVVREIAEDVSGAVLARVGLDEARNLARDHQIEALIVFDPDRLSRRVAHFALIQEELEAAHCALEFVNAPSEDTPEGRLMLMIRSSFAEYERAKIMERSRRGKQQLARNGKILGNWMRPLGYAYDQQNKQYVIDEATAPIVQRIFSLMASGEHTLYTLAMYLHEAGIPTQRGGQWRQPTLQNMIRNEAYKGTAHYNKRTGKLPNRIRRPRSEWIPVPVPAIVDEALWERANRQLSENAIHSRRNRRYNYLLTGLLVCARCGRRYEGHADGRPGHASYYRCPMRIRSEYRQLERKCSNVYLPLADTEERVWDAVERYMASDAPLQPLQDTQATVDTTTAYNAAQRALAALGREEERVLEAYRQGVIDLARLSSELDNIKRRRAAYDADLVRYAKERVVRDPTAALTVRAVKEGLAGGGLEFRDRRRVLLRLRVQISVDGDTLTVTGLFPHVLTVRI